MSQQEIVGPIFGWRFPILNALLQRLRQSGGLLQSRIRYLGQIPGQGSQPALPAPLDVARAHNVETWDWIDYKGRERKITVHRDVEQTG